MHADEDYIGDLPDRVQSTPFKYKQITKTGALLIFHPVYIHISEKCKDKNMYYRHIDTEI